MGQGRVKVCQSSSLVTINLLNFFIAIWKESGLNNILWKFFNSGIFSKLFFSPANLQNRSKSVSKLKNHNIWLKLCIFLQAIWIYLCFCILLLSPSLQNNRPILKKRNTIFPVQEIFIPKYLKNLWKIIILKNTNRKLSFPSIFAFKLVQTSLEKLALIMISNLFAISCNLQRYGLFYEARYHQKDLENIIKMKRAVRRPILQTNKIVPVYIPACNGILRGSSSWNIVHRHLRK